MPRESFNNLSQEKKNRIFSAAKIEFIRHPYEEVSINRVIKNAKISRGSFYLYFENKEDLYYFVLNDAFKIWHTYCIECCKWFYPEI